MNLEKCLPGLFFQTYYVSKEKSNCPLIIDALRFFKKFEKISNSSISLRYGKRVLINTKKDGFLEVVDYDPFKKILLVMGPEEALTESPLHWFIHHAREDVNAVLLIKNIEYIDKLGEKIPASEKNYPLWTIEKIKDILGLLRNSKIVIIKDIGVLFVGKSINEVEKQVLKIFGDLK